MSPTVPFSHLRPWGNLGLALSAPYGGTLACRLGQALNGAHWAPAPPKGGGETRLCASFWRRTYLAPPSGAATSRWDVAQRPVSAAASVGAGRLPLADSTRGGSRDAGAVRRLRGQAASLTGRSRGYHLAEGAFSVCTRPGKTLRCFPSFFSGYRPLRSRARSKLF